VMSWIGMIGLAVSPVCRVAGGGGRLLPSSENRDKKRRYGYVE